MERIVEIKLSDKQLIEEFGEDCELRGLAKETIRNYKSQLKIFSQFLKRTNRHFLHIDRDVLKEFIGYLREERGDSARRIKNYFSALSSFYDFLVYEKVVEKNYVLEVRKRYLRRYKKNPGDTSPRKIISVEEMSTFINSILDIRAKALAILLAKTGIRRGELIRIDESDINWDEMSITLKPTPKRSNRIVFFDDECVRIMKKWLAVRKEMNIKPGCRALFINSQGGRLQRNGVYSAIVKWAEKVGIHDSNSDKMEDHFPSHCFRHWFTTMLLRAGMPREYVKELRGDARSEAIDIYHHIDREELRKSYLACIPQLGLDSGVKILKNF